jgi:hypothetical protein
LVLKDRKKTLNMNVLEVIYDVDWFQLDEERFQYMHLFYLNPSYNTQWLLRCLTRRTLFGGVSEPDHAWPCYKRYSLK